MFVRYLNERQQGALLHYAHEMMRADGSVAGEVLVHLDALRKQVRPGVKAEDVPIEKLSSLFDDRLSRVAFLLEVVGTGYANRDFDPAESQLAKDLAEALPVGEDSILEDVKSWMVWEAHGLVRSLARYIDGVLGNGMGNRFHWTLEKLAAGPMFETLSKWSCGQYADEWEFSINRWLRDMGAQIDSNRTSELREIFLKFCDKAHEQRG